MRSLLLEFLRLNNLETGMWRAGDPYLVIAGTEYPVRQFNSPLDQEEFLTLVEALRYEGGDGQQSLAAVNEIGITASKLLDVPGLSALNGGLFPLQLDLVVNPAEVAAIPFEAALDSDGVPLFARPGKTVVITRRVRSAFSEHQTQWPLTPRILFGWAQPPGVGTVPASAHELALRQALAQWYPAGSGGVAAPNPSGLTVLPEMTLTALAECCAKACADSKPYTHVHLLAHGCPIDSGMKQVYGLALHNNEGDMEAVSAEHLIAALSPLKERTVVVTLAACDSANLTNTIIPRRSIAHDLHVTGFPIVVASQFPLTVTGSNHLVDTLYKLVLGGDDVRQVLLKVRQKLYEERSTCGHDWASMVSYVRLPEGYQEYVEDMGLKMMLSSLKAIRDQSNELLLHPDAPIEQFEELAGSLRERITTLTEQLARNQSAKRIGVQVENLGLLGSAEKRLAELCFAAGARSDDSTWIKKSREALANACDRYREGYYLNLSKHWPGVQMLSLEAALTGSFQQSDLWHAALAAAKLDARSKNIDESSWGYGSLIELLLLAPIASQPAAMAQALEAVAALKDKSRESGDPFPIDATKFQLARYEDWWTSANGYFPNRPDLRQDAMTLRVALLAA